MNDFISAIRTDRQREINEKLEKKIIIPDVKTYRFVSSIEVGVNGKMVELGVQANNNDVYFFITDLGGNSYFSIVELYEILLDICRNGDRKEVEDTLLKLINTKVEPMGEFYYKGVKYLMRPIVVPTKAGTVKLDDGGAELTYEKLFVLLNFIQEKSSALFMRGSSGNKNEKYIDGLLRLLIALLISRRDHDELQRRGWLYDAVNQKFELNDDGEVNDKYYLTDSDLSTIMKLES